MAGNLAMVERPNPPSPSPPPSTTMSASASVSGWEWRWTAQYSRCFTYPTTFLSTLSTLPPSLSTLDRGIFKPTWITGAAPSIVSLQPSDNSPDHSILTVSLHGHILEEHYISKLNFVWPQVSCLSGFPTRGSLAVIASYMDSACEKQKFALRFSAVSEVEDFITTLEDVLSNRIPVEPPAVDVISAISSQSEFVPPYRPDTSISAISSQSEFVPPYRPDTSNIITPIYDASVPMNFYTEDQDAAQTQIQNAVADFESNAVPFPPRFTSLVSNCSAEAEPSDLAITLASGLQEPYLNAQIAKYMQDGSFLDIVSKVNEVISELGGDFAI